MVVRLEPVTGKTVGAVCRLDAGDDGRQVAPNAVSIAQAYFEPAAWFRAIHADTPIQTDALVGFVMLYDPTRVAVPEMPQVYLWRLMIDRAHQGAGYGAAAVRLVIDHARTLPGMTELRVSHEPETARLTRFYQSLGFAYTGEVDDGELVMSLPLRP